MRSKKFDKIIAESPYKDYFEKVEKEVLEFFWSTIEGDPMIKLPINAYRSIRRKGFAVIMHGVGTVANLYVLLSDWSVYKSKPKGDTLAILMPKVVEVEKFLEEQ